MKAAIVLLCLAVCAVAAQESRTSTIANIPAASRLFGIKGGEKVKIEKRPYTVALVLHGNKYLGAGVVVNKNWILTAATNLFIYDPDDVTIRVGSENALNGGTVVKARQFVLHPGYKGEWEFNIAMIRLDHSLKFGPKTKPVRFADTLPNAGANTAVTGYGAMEYEMKTDGILRDAIVPYIPNKVCAKKYHGSTPAFTSQDFCASKPGVGPCPLDWGDPLVYNGKLIGLFSGSLGDCGSAKYPGVFIDVTQFRKWIKDTINP